MASSLPALSESEQKSCNGESFVYDQSGAFLGERGTGNDIIIASTLYEAGYALSTASPDIVSRVMTTIGNNMGIVGTIGITYENRIYAYHDPNNGRIYVNYNGDLVSNNNYYDIVSILRYEQYHQMTIGYSTTWEQNEYQAFIYQMNDPSFQNVSWNVRNETVTNFGLLHVNQTYNP